MTTLREMQKACSDFLSLDPIPQLIKCLPSRGKICKVKLRHQRVAGHRKVVESFDSTFGRQGFLGKVMAVNGSSKSCDGKDGYEQYMIFPPNGSKFLHNPSVKDSIEDYSKVWEKLDGVLGCSDDTLLATMLKCQYIEGLPPAGGYQNAEVLIYNTPAVYAVKLSIFDSPQQLLEIVSPYE